MTSTETSVLESCANASARASAGPPWSALISTRSVRFSPADVCDMKSSSVTALLLAPRLFASRPGRPPRRGAVVVRAAAGPLAALCNLARLRGILDDAELVAGHRHAR